MLGVVSVTALTLFLSSTAPADPSAPLAPGSVSAGGTHTCAIRADATITCWGDDSAGQLDGIPSGAFRAISAGGAHSCAIATGGTLACWGDDSAGQLDEVPTGEFRSISAGGAHSCAIRADGTLACWGDDSAGQLDEVPTGEFRSISAGGAHSCAIRADGTLACWGYDGSGQVDGAPTEKAVAVPYHLHKHHNDHHHHHYKDDPPQTEVATFIAVGAGDDHTCAIDDDGELDCWGDDSAGQLDGIPSGKFLSVAAGGAHSCAIGASGALACWGDDASGQLSGAPLGAFLSVSAGGAHNCAISAAGQAACWGDNALWQVQPELVGDDPPAGVTGAAYSHSFETTPQAPGPAFSVIAGTPPPGLALDAGGVLAGKPTKAGAYAFTVAASNGVVADATREVTLKVTDPPAPAVKKAAPPPPDPGLPDPTAGLNFNLEPIAGVSKVKCASDGDFSLLTVPKQVPIDCQVDVQKGVVRMTTANGEGAGTQSGFFWAGAFNVSQSAADNWITNLRVAGRLKCERRKGSKAGARVSRRKLKRGRRGGGRKLWGSGKGRFKTSGNYGSATVRGTVWLVRDRCDNSTLFKVREGIVTIEDFVKGKTVTITPGKNYVAKAAIPRLR